MPHDVLFLVFYDLVYNWSGCKMKFHQSGRRTYLHGCSNLRVICIEVKKYLCLTMCFNIPTLSPFATCGNRLFKCGDREFFQNLHFNRKVLQIAVFRAYFSQLWRQQRDCCHKSGECGDRNILIGHRWSNIRIVAFYLNWRY